MNLELSVIIIVKLSHYKDLSVFFSNNFKNKCMAVLLRPAKFGPIIPCRGKTICLHFVLIKLFLYSINVVINFARDDFVNSIMYGLVIVTYCNKLCLVDCVATRRFNIYRRQRWLFVLVVSTFEDKRAHIKYTPLTM